MLAAICFVKPQYDCRATMRSVLAILSLIQVPKPYIPYISLDTPIDTRYGNLFEVP